MDLNPGALLALIAELYAQLSAVRAENDALKRSIAAMQKPQRIEDLKVAEDAT